MAAQRSPEWPLAIVLLFLLVLSSSGGGYLYKVGDLNAWGPPPPSNPRLYALWPLAHSFRPGDSLLFLYPPSEDSVLEVTEAAYDACDVVTAPILSMSGGYSLFNITRPGTFYFTSGVKGRCAKRQKLRISVTNNATFFPPAADASAASPSAAASPAYPNMFGPSASANQISAAAGSSIYTATTAVAGGLVVLVVSLVFL